jgi:hypothetical protein
MTLGRAKTLCLHYGLQFYYDHQEHLWTLYDKTDDPLPADYLLRWHIERMTEEKFFECYIKPRIDLPQK